MSEKRDEPGIDWRLSEALARLRAPGARETSCIACGSREIAVVFVNREDPTVKMGMCMGHALRAIEWAGAAMWSHEIVGMEAHELRARIERGKV